MEFTRVKVRNSYVRVCNEDMPVLEKEMEGVDKEVANAIDPKDLQDSMDRVKELNDQISTLNGERDTLSEQLQTLQGQLADLTSDGNMSDRLDQAMSDQQSAQDIINTGDLDVDKERRFGNSLKRYVVERYRAKNKLSELPKERLDSEQYISGVFDMLHVEAGNKKSVTGANVVQLKNSEADHAELDPREAAHLRVANSRRKAAERILGGKK